MKTLLGILVAFFVALAALVLLDGYQDLEHELETLALANDDLRQQVDVLEDRITALDSSRPRLPAPAAPTAAAPGSNAVSTAALEQLVARMIAEDRDANRVRVQSEVDQRLSSWREQRSGTGDVSGRAAMLRDALDLDVAQTAEYDALADRFEARAQALYATVDATDMSAYTAQMDSIQRDLDALSDEFDAAFGAVLTAGQLAAYDALPDDSRGLAPDAGVQAMEFDLATMLRMAEADDTP